MVLYQSEMGCAPTLLWPGWMLIGTSNELKELCIIHALFNMDWMPPWLRANVSTRHSFLRLRLLSIAIPWLVMVESPHFSWAFNSESLDMFDLQGNVWVKMCTEQGTGAMFRSWLSCCRVEGRGRNYWTSPADRSCVRLFSHSRLSYRRCIQGISGSRHEINVANHDLVRRLKLHGGELESGKLHSNLKVTTVETPVWKLVLLLECYQWNWMNMHICT